MLVRSQFDDVSSGVSVSPSFTRYVCGKLESQICPGGSIVKNPPASAGDACAIPRMGRSHILWSPCATNAEPDLINVSIIASTNLHINMEPP